MSNQPRSPKVGDTARFYLPRNGQMVLFSGPISAITSTGRAHVDADLGDRDRKVWSIPLKLKPQPDGSWLLPARYNDW